MTDAEYEKAKKRVQSFIDKWFTTLGLGWWRVDMQWYQSKDDDEIDTAARTTWRWQYRTASINWYLPILAEMNDEKLEATVVHEFAHILTGPMVQNAPEENHQLMEYGTETVARALIWAREAGERTAAKKTRKTAKK